jgi:hypothetical protein
MASDIFDFLQSDWLQQRAAFYDILSVVQIKELFTYFLATNRGVHEDNFQTQNTTQKV